MKHIPRAQVVAYLKIPVKREEYKPSVQAYEKLFNDTPPGQQLRNPASKIQMPSWVHSEKESGEKKTKVYGVRWPKSVLDKFKVQYADDDLEACSSEDEPFLVRDNIHGVPSFCTVIDSYKKKAVKAVKEVGSSASAMTNDEVSDKAKALTRGKTVGEIVVLPSGAEKVKLTSVGRDLRGGDDDEWDDLLPTFTGKEEETPSPVDSSASSAPVAKKLFKKK